MTTTTAEASPVMSAKEVALLVGVSKRAIELASHNPKSPYFAAKINDGIDRIRFRRVDIEAIVHGRKAAVVPMQRGAK